MIAFFATLLRLFFQAFRSKRNVLSENALLKKENEILLRKVGNKRVRFSFYDKLFFVVLNKAADIKYRLTLIKPETLLSWQRTVIRRFWTFEHAPAKRGRKPVDTEVKNLILSMKNDNLLCAQYEQHHGTVFQDSEKRGARQFPADWQESDREDSGGKYRFR